MATGRTRRASGKRDPLVARIGRGRFLFGCRALRFVSFSALRATPQTYPQDAIRRQVEFLSCLINPADGRFTYDLRLISRPDPGLYTRGSIDLVLLGRIDRATVAEARTHATGILRLLETAVIEADWSPVPPEELPLLMRPFEPRALVSITRRSQRLALDSLHTERPWPRAGFERPLDGEPAPTPPGGAFHVFPFLPAFGPHTTLFSRLLLHPHPLVLSARMTPTRLDPAEARFLEEQIAQCEKHAQLHLGPPSGELEALRPTLQRRAQQLEQYYLRFLNTLGDDAAVVTFDVASPKPIPRSLVEAIGHFISQPAAIPGDGDPAGLDRTLAGGYETVVRDGDTAAMEALETLHMAPAHGPHTPPAAGRLLHLFAPGEAVAVFRFPLAGREAPHGIPVRRAPYRPAPPQLDQRGALAGTSGIHGTRQEVRLAEEDRLRHFYVVGQTGTGKTSLLRTMILDDMRSGAGLCVLDPHGDLYTELLGLVPEERIDDVILVDPSDPECPAAINLLEHSGEAERYFIVQEIVGIMSRLLSDQYGTASHDFAGPVFFEHLRNNLLLVMSHPERTATIRDFFELFSSPQAWMGWVHPGITDPLLKAWIGHVLPNVDYTQRSDGNISIGEYVGSKFQEFVFDPSVRHIFEQPRSSFDITEIMNTGGILLINLSKGLLTESTSRFLGMVILSRILAAAMGRVRLPAGRRRPFFAYVDEFHSLATSSFVSMLSEGRKFGLGLVLANQFVSQLEANDIVDSIFGNVGSMAAFRLGQKDASLVAPLMAPVFTEADLVRLPNWQAAMVALFHGQSLEPFTLETVPPREIPDPSRAARVRAASRRRHLERLGKTPEEPARDGADTAEPQPGDGEAVEGAEPRPMSREERARAVRTAFLSLFDDGDGTTSEEEKERAFEFTHQLIKRELRKMEQKMQSTTPPADPDPEPSS